jgi:hypothetical protein
MFQNEFGKALMKYNIVLKLLDVHSTEYISLSGMPSRCEFT